MGKRMRRSDAQPSGHSFLFFLQLAGAVLPSSPPALHTSLCLRLSYSYFCLPIVFLFLDNTLPPTLLPSLPALAPCSFLLVSISTPVSLSLSVSWLWFSLVSACLSLSLSYLETYLSLPPPRFHLLLSDSPQPGRMVLLARPENLTHLCQPSLHPPGGSLLYGLGTGMEWTGALVPPCKGWERRRQMAAPLSTKDIPAIC